MALLLIVVIAILVYYFALNQDGSANLLRPSNVKRCPNCKNPVEPTFIVCPICKETLRRTCAHCGESLEASWKYCPFCKVHCKCDEVCNCNHG